MGPSGVAHPTSGTPRDELRSSRIKGDRPGPVFWTDGLQSDSGLYTDPYPKYAGVWHNSTGSDAQVHPVFGRE